MNSPESPATSPATSASLIKRHPVAAFVAIAITLSWAAQIGSILLIGNILPGILAELLILLGTAVLVTGSASGRPAVRELFRRAFRWRVAPGWYVAALLAVPALNMVIAAATVTFHPPAEGWAPLLGSYLLNTVVTGALMGLAYLGTGHSLLIVGLLHGSFNASAEAKLDVFDGGRQQIAAVIVLLGGVAAARILRSPRRAGQQPLPDLRERTHQHPAEAAGTSPAEETGHGSPPAG
ncbi:hypothetical protein ABFP37_12775 [Burkholderia sp. RS01]|uniref:hypothetical protein n=1 Tax=unclassified Burkholderia TaxID=2613784 RepID=UPI003218A45C